MANIVTEATASITGTNEYATLTSVPAGRRVSISVSGIAGGSIITLEALWGGVAGGTYEIQKSFDTDPTEAEHWTGPFPCTLRIGIGSGGTYGSGTQTVGIRYNYGRTL